MISMDKQYRYRNGNPARVLCVDGPNTAFPVISIDSRGIPFTHTGDGKVCSIVAIDKPHDLIEVTPWDDFEIDEPVIVDCVSHLLRRHFAGVDERGYPMTWDRGGTSWTENERSSWHECRRPTTEELDGEA